ncbi:GNAT family N-acetyltransferase [Glutamicibacter creatinolyticus]|uniref:GNAT family N-acetyltransferase n=1 Tax=Glutamicibacter creatinolyticus TaxID=162496 RepID=UPI0037C0E7B5
MFSSWLPRPALDVLESDRLLLRGLTRKDYEAWMHLRWVNSQWLQPWEPTDPAGRTPTTTFQQMVRSQRQSALEGTGYCWVVTLKDPHAANPPLIGQVSLSGIQLGAARSASIGYWIDHGHAGFGYIPEAVALVGDYGYAKLGLHRLEINIRPENAASLRVVEKLRFRDEGVRERFLHINGQWRDHRTFALNREDFSGTLLERINESRPEPRP